MIKFAVSSLLLGLVACGPAARSDDFGNGGGDGGGSGSGGTGFATEVSCTDGVDNDGDGKVDCSDPDCSGIDGCPICGQVDQPQAMAINLPDGKGGVGTAGGPTCTTNADCSASAPNCVSFLSSSGNGQTEHECHASYTDTLHFVGFPDGATLASAAGLVKVCATMEHSWIRDLQIDLIAPSGQKIGLLNFKDRNGNVLYLGHPDESDNPAKVGTGLEYCWTEGTTATKHMLDSGIQYGSYNGAPMLPAGDYLPDNGFAGLVGGSLNGDWEFRVTDLWAEDDGHLFDWSITFDSSLIADCSGPIIE